MYFFYLFILQYISQNKAKLIAISQASWCKKNSWLLTFIVFYNRHITIRQDTEMKFPAVDKRIIILYDNQGFPIATGSIQ